MIEFTTQQLATDTAHIQRLAQNYPVMIADGENKQVLMTYDDYLKLGGQNEPTTYDVFVKQIAEHFSQEELEMLAEMDIDDDMSKSEHI